MVPSRKVEGETSISHCCEIARGARNRLPVMSEGEKKSVSAFEHGARPEKSFAPDACGMQADSRRQPACRRLVQAPSARYSMIPRHAARDAERVHRLLRSRPSAADTPSVAAMARARWWDEYPAL